MGKRNLDTCGFHIDNHEEDGNCCDEGKDILTAVIFPDVEHFKSQAVAQIKDRIRFEIETLSIDLPVYKRVNKYMIVNEPLPKTLLGKVKRFEVQNIYSAGKGESRKVVPQGSLSAEDAKILSCPLCFEALEYLSKKLNRKITLDDNLELDLGLDSLERIGLFFEFQKMSKLELDEKPFFFVSTMRDVLSKLYEASIAANGSSMPLKAGLQDIFTGEIEHRLRQEVTLEQGLLAKTANFFFTLFLKTLFGGFYRLKVNGRQNLPLKGPYILCPNHASYFDPPIIAASLSLPVLYNTYFLGFSAILNHPSLSWGKKLFRLIPIDPGAKLEESLKLCSFVLKNSKILCMFPEGGRSIDGNLLEFKRGVALFIKELNVPVVPVYINGSYKAWSAKDKLPKLTKIEVTFGPVLTIEELVSEKRESIDIYQNIAHTLRDKISLLARENVSPR